MPSPGIFLLVSEDLLVLSLPFPAFIKKETPVLFKTATEIDAGGKI